MKSALLGEFKHRPHSVLPKAVAHDLILSWPDLVARNDNLFCQTTLFSWKSWMFLAPNKHKKNFFVCPIFVRCVAIRLNRTFLRRFLAKNEKPWRGDKRSVQPGAFWSCSCDFDKNSDRIEWFLRACLLFLTNEALPNAYWMWRVTGSSISNL